MIPSRKFQEFLDLGIVKKQTPNKERARSLIKEAEGKKHFLMIALKNIPKEEINPNFIVDSCYDIFMELIRARMFQDGFNAGNSHEAEISYSQLLGFNESEVRFMNSIRYYRNGTKYYGSILSEEYAKSVFNFLNKIYPKLITLVKKNK
jgi:hypothetical protein